MATREVIALNETTPQLLAPQAGDTYLMPRELSIVLGAITTDRKILDLSATWNAAGVTLSGMKLNVTDTASAAGSLLMDLQVGGVSKFSVNKTGIVDSTSGFRASGGGANVLIKNNAGNLYFGANDDIVVARDAAATLAIRDGVNAQTLRLYNTFTDASNYERNTTTWASNVCYLKNENAGTGAARLLVPVTGSTTVAALPAAATAGQGARSMVTDASSPAFGSAVAAGGAVKIPVFSDGTNWIVG